MTGANSFKEECNRLDIFHKMFSQARNGSLFPAPMDVTKPLHVLDLGTGTAIWPINMSEYRLPWRPHDSGFSDQIC
jgi:ubiquinone/menaquinone biosynthesis C-methylase UbiE